MGLEVRMTTSHQVGTAIRYPMDRRLVVGVGRTGLVLHLACWL